MNIRWERNENPAGCVAAGWRAYVGDHYVGTVYADGDAFFGHDALRRKRYPESVLPYSQPLAAQALVRYVEAGGR